MHRRPKGGLWCVGAPTRVTHSGVSVTVRCSCHLIKWQEATPQPFR